MLLFVVSLFLGICAAANAAVATRAAGHRLLSVSSGSESEAAPLSTSDLVIVYATTPNRLPLVHATRPARRGIRTYIVLQDASEVARLNELYGGSAGEHNETYFAWVDPAAVGQGGGGGGLYGRNPPLAMHPLHLLGPAWAMGPLLAHAAILAATSTPPASTTTSTSEDGSAADGAAASTDAAAAVAPPPRPYRWMLVARDDTLWRPHSALRLLSQFDAGVAAAIADHLVDFNGHKLLAPSPAAAVCLPCSFNLTALLGRRHPPGVPQPACPVCRPAGGCEFRFDLCGGLVGGPQCGSKRFLGSGDRCSHSWVAGGAGVALSVTLLSYLDQEDWAGCVRGVRPSTGERSLGRCLWRNGFSFTHPAAGLAEGLTRDVFSDHHMLFGNPLLRQAVFGPQADQVLSSAYKAAEQEAAAKAAAWRAGVAAATAAGGDAEVEAAAAPPTVGAVATVPASTRLRPEGSAECDTKCQQWLSSHGLSVHLDVPYVDGVDMAAAAEQLKMAAEREVSAALEKSR